MFLLTLALTWSSLVSAVPPNVPQTAIVCAAYLDNAAELGVPMSARVAEEHYNDLINKAQASAANLAPTYKPLSIVDRLLAWFRQTPSARFISKDLNAPLTDPAEVAKRQRLVTHLTTVRDSILNVSTPESPLRRISTAPDQIVRGLLKIKKQALDDEYKLEEKYARTITGLLAKRAESVEARYARVHKMIDKARVEGRQSWSQRIFGPDSDLGPGGRLLAMASYAKTAVSVSMFSAMINPLLVPYTAGAFVVGWFGVRQWMYLSGNTFWMFARSLWDEQMLGRKVSRIEAYRRDVARSEEIIADIDTMVTLVGNKTPNAVASLSYDIKLPIRPEPTEIAAALSGESIRRDAAALVDPTQRAQLHLVLTTDASGQPKLTSTLLTREGDKISSFSALGLDASDVFFLVIYGGLELFTP